MTDDLRREIDRQIEKIDARTRDRLRRASPHAPLDAKTVNRPRGYRKMTADELYDDIKALADRHDLPVGVDGSADRIPVIVRHLAWELCFYPQTVPVRIERRGELPDRSDDLWSPLWRHLDQLGTSREAVKPLSKKGYRLLSEFDPEPSPLEKTMGIDRSKVGETK